eukprot:5377822-Amphidinium_carterae.2
MSPPVCRRLFLLKLVCLRVEVALPHNLFRNAFPIFLRCGFVALSQNHKYVKPTRPNCFIP